MTIIDPTYLPYSPEELKPHFLGNADGHVSYYQRSADRYHRFQSENKDLRGIPISEAKRPRQIEKDERFWTVTAMKRLYDAEQRKSLFEGLLSATYGRVPPVDSLSSWDECLCGDLRLYFEVQLPSPPSYVAWLRRNLEKQQLIPYVLDAAERANDRTLEGATRADALILNCDNGFALIIEAKVLSDISPHTSFDSARNQLARNIDVMLEASTGMGPPLSCRSPARTLFALLTPAVFREKPESRLYGWLFQEYSRNPEALARDMPHREGIDWGNIAQRIGWLTFEETEAILPGACPWIG